MSTAGQLPGNPMANAFMSFMLNVFLMKVVAAGGGAAAGSVAGPLGTLGGAVVSIVKV